MNYSLTLRINGADHAIPVLPEKLEISSPGKNEKTEILTLGEVVLPRLKGLRTIKWESHFPAHSASYSTAAVTRPIELVRTIQAARDALRPLRLILTGGEMDINIDAAVASFNYEERYGAVGDLFYSIELTEYRKFGPAEIDLPAPMTDRASPVLYESEPPRAGEPVVPQSHTVVAGDSLWAIAKRFLGDGNRYPELYAANQEQIDARNRGTGNSKYTIYPGQVFVIP